MASGLAALVEMMDMVKATSEKRENKCNIFMGPYLLKIIMIGEEGCTVLKMKSHGWEDQLFIIETRAMMWIY